MIPLSTGRYRARLATTPAEVAATQRLRHQSFRATGGTGTAKGAGTAEGQAGDIRRGPDGFDADGSDADAYDADAFDADCDHMLIEEAETGELVCCYRLLTFGSAAEIHRSYAAQFYDLTRLSGFAGPVLELGRFCLRGGAHDPDILRLAWAALTRIVDARRVTLLFGCSSFPGADPRAHRAALALLAQGHLAPQMWAPGVRATGAHVFASAPLRAPGDIRAGLQGLPPLLRTYLLMGGWVSNHAVPDPDLNTLHVFTAVEIAAIPPARARALRALAG